MLGDLFGDSLPPQPPRQSYEHRRASDAHKNRNRLITILCSFALWWAGSFYADYRSQAVVVHKQEVQIAELHKDVEALRRDVQTNANLSSDERKAQLIRIDRIEAKLDSLGDKLIGGRWFRGKKSGEDENGGGGGAP